MSVRSNVYFIGGADMSDNGQVASVSDSVNIVTSISARAKGASAMNTPRMNHAASATSGIVHNFI